MSALPNILVAGGELVYIELMERFPRTVARLLYCDTLGQALDRAADATLVIVDYQMEGGGEGLCQRLRSDPISGDVPIVLRAPAGTQSRFADYVVEPNDVEQVAHAIRHYCPAVVNPPAFDQLPDDYLDEDETFDIESNTVIWRRPEAGGSIEKIDIDGVWPPHPPELLPEQDLLEFTRAYAGYVNSLLEAYQSPDSLAPEERTRLSDVAANVLESMDAMLSQTQTAVNEALMAKDIDRMREMTSARNVMYEKLQRLKLVAPRDDAAAGISPSSDNLAAASAPASSSSSGPPGPGIAPASGRSELSRAAEEIERKQAQAAKTAGKSKSKSKSKAPRKPTRQRRITGSAKRPQRSYKRLAIILVVLLAGAGGAVGYSIYRRHTGAGTTDGTAKKTTPGGNRPPAMQRVDVKVTAAGIVATAKAHDPEGDPVSFIIRWSVNGQPVKGAVSARLAKQFYKRGDRVQVLVTPTDPQKRGRPMLSQPLVIK